jgi:hypothetical protein
VDVVSVVPRTAQAARREGLSLACELLGCDGVVVWELHSGREHLVLVPQGVVAGLRAGGVSCGAVQQQFL